MEKTEKYSVRIGCWEPTIYVATAAEEAVRMAYRDGGVAEEHHLTISEVFGCSRDNVRGSNVVTSDQCGRRQYFAASFVR